MQPLNKLAPSPGNTALALVQKWRIHIRVSAALEIIDTPMWEGMAMPITLTINVLIKDGTLH